MAMSHLGIRHTTCCAPWQYKSTTLESAAMSTAVWLSLFVFLTNAIPLEHTYTAFRSSLESTLTSNHDATGLDIIIDDEMFLKIARIVNSSSSSSPSNSSTRGTSFSGDRKKRNLGEEPTSKVFQPDNLRAMSIKRNRDKLNVNERKFDLELKRVKREVDVDDRVSKKQDNGGPNDIVETNAVDTKDMGNEYQKTPSIKTGEKMLSATQAELTDNISESTINIRSEKTGDIFVDKSLESKENNVSDKTTDNQAAKAEDNTADNTNEETTDGPASSTEDNITADKFRKLEIIEVPASPARNQTTLQPFMTCEHVPSFYTPRWLWMVSECPPSWSDDTVRELCLAQRNAHTLSLLELLVSLPVQDSEGNVYANEHCARCQGVVIHTPWTAEVVCKPTNAMPEMPNSKMGFPEFNRQLSNYFAGPDCERKIQPAIPSGVRDCKTGRLIQRYHPFWPGRYTRTQTGPRTTGNGIPFTILFNFDFTGRKNLMFEVSTRVEHEKTTGFRCRDWETFDPHINDCRQVNCNRDYILVDNKCVPASVMDNSDRFTITSLTELNLVQQATKVTIRMNVSISAMEIENSDNEKTKTELADILQVGVERMKNFHLSFRPGSIPNARFRYEVLTKEQYEELFPRLPDPSPEDLGDYDDDKPQGPESASDVELKAKASTEGTDSKSPGADDGANGDDGNDPGSNGSDESTDFYASGNDQMDNSVRNSQNDTASGTTVSTDAAYSEIGQNDGGNTDSTSNGMLQSADSEVNAIPRNVTQPMVMQIDFVLVPSHNISDGDSRKLMRRIRQLNHRFIIQMVDGDIMFKETPLPEDFADTTQFCPWGIEHKLESEEFTVMEDTDGNPMLYINKTNKYLKMGRFDLFIKMAGDDASDLTNVREEAEFAFGCFMPRINERNCVRISLKSEEYTIEGTQKDLVFEGHTYDVFSYYVSNETTGEVQICMPKSFNKRLLVSKSKWYAVVESCGSSFQRVQQAEAMITDILGHVSLVALCMVLITYFLFPRLRNLPGINTINLTFALLVAESMFSHGIDAKLPWLCTAVAISMHYLFLAAHFWMNVMSYDVYRTFVGDVSGSMPMKRVKDKKKYVPLYSLYAWGTPLIIVAFCVLVDKSDLFTGISIGYGVSSSTTPDVPPSATNSSFDNSTILVDEPDALLPNSGPTVSSYLDNTTTTTAQVTTTIKRAIMYGPSQLSYCWIAQPLAAFITFGAPLLIIFTVNCIFFARIITTISRTARLSKTRLQTSHSTTSLIRKQPGRSDAVLYLRMSTVMGLTWIFGLTSSIVSSFSRPAFEICVISHILGILFTIFNVSQGIFIFCAFVCNRRVWNLYRALFTRMRAAMSDRSNKTNIYVVNSSTTLSNLSEGVTARQENRCR